MNEKQMYSEVYAVLLKLDEEYTSRIPEDVFETIKEQSDEALMPEIDENKGLGDQGLSKDAIALMAYLRLEYWCDSEEEKREFMEYLKANGEEMDNMIAATNSLRGRLHLIRDNK